MRRIGAFAFAAACYHPVTLEDRSERGEAAFAGVITSLA
jgi:hypothetical protein